MTYVNGSIKRLDNNDHYRANNDIYVYIYRSFQNTTLNRGTLIRLPVVGRSAALIAHKSTPFRRNLDFKV